MDFDLDAIAYGSGLASELELHLQPLLTRGFELCCGCRGDKISVLIDIASGYQRPECFELGVQVGIGFTNDRHADESGFVGLSDPRKTER